MRVRAGNTPIYDSTWSNWFIASNGDSIPDSLNAQYIQYMAHLRYTNPAYLPCLFEVRISYDTLTGIDTYDEPGIKIPLSISPNPFTTKTKISYTVSTPKTTVTIEIYDCTGRIIKTLVDRTHTSNTYDIVWSGNDDKNQVLPEGIYYLIYESGDSPGTANVYKVIHLKE